MFVSGKDASQEGLTLKILNEIVGHGIFALTLVVTAWLGNFAIGQLCLVCPKANGSPPDIIGIERHMHTQHDGKSFGHFLLEQLNLLVGHIAIDIIKRDEVYAVDDLTIQRDIERIDVLKNVARIVLVFFAFLFLGIAQPHVSAELMVAHGTNETLTEILLHQVEVRLALPVNEVTRMNHIVHMLLGPGQCIAQRLLLPPTKGSGAAAMKLLFLLVLMIIGGSEVGIGNMQDREMLLFCLTYLPVILNCHHLLRFRLHLLLLWSIYLFS